MENRSSLLFHRVTPFFMKTSCLRRDEQSIAAHLNRSGCDTGSDGRGSSRAEGQTRWKVVHSDILARRVLITKTIPIHTSRARLNCRGSATRGKQVEILISGSHKGLAQLLHPDRFRAQIRRIQSKLMPIIGQDFRQSTFLTLTPLFLLSWIRLSCPPKRNRQELMTCHNKYQRHKLRSCIRGCLIRIRLCKMDWMIKNTTMGLIKKKGIYSMNLTLEKKRALSANSWTMVTIPTKMISKTNRLRRS